jgi:hypothetical protein
MVTVTGSSTHINGEERFLSYSDSVQHSISTGVLRHDDPRAKLDPNDISRLGLRTSQGLESAANAMYPTRKAANGQEQTRNDLQKGAAVRSSFAMAQSMSEGEDRTILGQPGRIAQSLEATALKLYAQDPKDERSLQLLKISAAYHNLGSAEKAREGYENHSVIEAAATQKRNPLSIAEDLRSNKIMDPSDIRLKIKSSDVQIDKEEAIKRVQTSDNISGLNQARLAERTAVSLSKSMDGSQFQKETNQQNAFKMLTGAYALETIRQADLSVQNTQETVPTQRTSKTAAAR